MSPGVLNLKQIISSFTPVSALRTINTDWMLKQLVVDSVFVLLVVMTGFRHTVIQIMYSQSLKNSDLQCVT